MNNVERVLLEQMENAKFQNAVRDDLSCIDSLIDDRDLERVNANSKNSEIQKGE